MLLLTHISDLYRIAEQVGNTAARQHAELAFEYARSGKHVDAFTEARAANRLLGYPINPMLL